MVNYLLRRLLLLPLTLFAIVLVNFTIINMAPGDPVSVTEVSQEGGAQRREDKSQAFGSDDRYLQFREHYGLTLPILFNTWPGIDRDTVREHLWQLTYRKEGPQSKREMPVKDYDALRIRTGDQARYTMSHLLAIAEDESEAPELRATAVRFFVRGGTRQAHLGPGLPKAQRQENREIADDNQFLRKLSIPAGAPVAVWTQTLEGMRSWYEKRKDSLRFEPSRSQALWMLAFETRFSRYMGRVLTLDFGTMRNDDNRTVIREVAKRFKYSLTLAILPMLITFVLCQIFGFYMAYKQNQWPDVAMNVVFLI
ncbi:MAG: ABC transporter permease, partial [Chlamydiia bacterium]|nr:ABC transporter permease [Chlamydiia bacterium]